MALWDGTVSILGLRAAAEKFFKNNLFLPIRSAASSRHSLVTMKTHLATQKGLFRSQGSNYFVIKTTCCTYDFIAHFYKQRLYNFDITYCAWFLYELIS